jgi:quercetin dioxygenase-like cupin family protein
MSDRFEDHRGVIQDLLVTPLDGVTEIRTVRGAIRGNHFHKATTQWTYIASGRMLIVTDSPAGRQERVYGPGEMACEEPGTSHAWHALEDTVCVVFSRGPRTGEAYESDTFRLETPLL